MNNHAERGRINITNTYLLLVCGCGGLPLVHIIAMRRTIICVNARKKKRAYSMFLDILL